MSYTTNITEEITIRNTSAKAAHIAAQIHHYLQELDSMSYIGRFLIVHAALDADGNHVEVRDQWKDIDGLYRREFDEFGKETRVYWREDIVPSAYHGLMNLAASLRRSSPFKEPVKDITFRIDYFCECSLATIGIEFWKEVFEAMDCEELRQQVRYSCVQDYDSEERTAFAYRYDEKGFHEVTHQPGFDAIADTEVLDFHRLLAKTTYFDTMQPLAFPTSARVRTNPHESALHPHYIRTSSSFKRIS